MPLPLSFLAPPWTVHSPMTIPLVESQKAQLATEISRPAIGWIRHDGEDKDTGTRIRAIHST
jgi:hypothetical protein